MGVRKELAFRVYDGRISAAHAQRRCRVAMKTPGYFLSAAIVEAASGSGKPYQVVQTALVGPDGKIAMLFRYRRSGKVEGTHWACRYARLTTEWTPTSEDPMWEWEQGADIVTCDPIPDGKEP